MNSVIKMCKPLGLLAIVLLQLVTIVNAGTLSSTVNRNQISANETLTLTVNYDEQVDSSLLDLKNLEQDFEVLGISPQTSSSVSIVNGQASRQASTIWTITLVAKRSGTLSIPAFSIKQDRSKPISIMVADGNATPAAAVPLTARVSTDKASVYPSQQLVVEVELSAQSNVSDLNGPQLIINGADVELLDQQRYQRIDNGVARQVVVLRYAAFAKQAGELIIPVMTYTGIKGGRRSLFGTRGQQVIARTTQLEVPVAELPASNGAPWFPADDVQISSSWSRDSSEIKVGEPITRTISITAKGQQASLIPPTVRLEAAKNYKTYQDQPQLENRKTAQGFVATRTESEAIVASSEGQLTLPELKVDWWDVKNDRWQTATLASETLLVAAGDAVNTPSGDTTQDTNESGSGTGNSVQPSDNSIWQWLTAALGILCLVQFGLIYKLQRRESDKTTIDYDNSSETTAWAKLQNSFKKEDPSTIRRDLISWAKSALPGHEQPSLQTLCNYADCNSVSGGSNITAALTQLDAHLYQDRSEFDVKQVKEAVNALRNQILRAKQNESKITDKLPPLYKT